MCVAGDKQLIHSLFFLVLSHAQQAATPLLSHTHTHSRLSLRSTHLQISGLPALLGWPSMTGRPALLLSPSCQRIEALGKMYWGACIGGSLVLLSMGHTGRCTQPPPPPPQGEYSSYCSICSLSKSWLFAAVAATASVGQCLLAAHL